MRVDANTVARAARLETLARRIGFAILQIQALEGASAQYLVLRTKTQRGMEAKAAQALVDAARREVFGQTIGAMKRAGLLSEDLGKRFKTLLDERNWLVHRSRGDNSAALLSDELTSTLVARVDRAEKEARKLLHEIADLSRQFVLDSGVSEEAVNAATATELVRLWEANDAI
jgi:hypothetical protein